MRRNILTALLVIVFGAGTVSALWHCHKGMYWPFAQASGVPAFLGTEFEMSLPEAQRALSRYGCRLVTFDAYKKAEETPKFESDWKFSLDECLYGISEDKRETQNTDRYYMPSVRMRNSKVEGRFAFLRGRLFRVEVYFEPIDASKADDVLASIEDDLNNRFMLHNRAHAEGQTNSYTHFYSNSLINASMFVDRRKPEKPVFDIGLYYRKVSEVKRQRIDKRDKEAFGH
jgi:hypothetical protein